MVKVIRVGVPVLAVMLFAGLATGQDAEQSLRNIQDELHRLVEQQERQARSNQDPCSPNHIYNSPQADGGLGDASNCAQKRQAEARMRFLQNQLLEQQVRALEQANAQSISQQPSPCRPPKEVMKKVSNALNMQRAKIAEQQKSLEEQQTRIKFLTTELQTVTKLAARSYPSGARPD